MGRDRVGGEVFVVSNESNVRRYPAARHPGPVRRVPCQHRAHRHLCAPRRMDAAVFAALIMGAMLVLVFLAALRLRKRGKAPRARRGAPAESGDEMQRELDRRARPSEKVREVVGLYLYPVKSCAGTSVREAHTCATGFENDRQWLVVNEKARGTGGGPGRAHGRDKHHPRPEFAGRVPNPAPAPRDGAHRARAAPRRRCVVARV